jgi:hypothetical protein
MSEMKPTPGEWRAKQLGGYENPGWVVLWPDKGGTHMRRLDYQGNFTEADARLIAEAGTVFHETGLSPRQLADLLIAIVAAADSKQAAGGEMWFAEAVAGPISAATAALAKCQPKPQKGKT